MKKKKKVLATVAILAFAMVACGQKAGYNDVDGKVDDKEKILPTLISIEGKEYDLSGDFQTVVGKMVEDGNLVLHHRYSYSYDEAGKWGETIYTPSECYVYAGEGDVGHLIGAFDTEGNCHAAVKDGYFIRKDFYLFAMEEKKMEYGLGISSARDVEKAMDTAMFMETEYPVRAMGEKGYTAVFVDGSALDFSDYEDRLEELKAFSGTAEMGILAEFLSYRLALDLSYLSGNFHNSKIGSRTYDSLVKNLDMDADSLDKELLILFALDDAYEQLEKGKIESFVVVRFGFSEDEETLNMAYSEFYFDETWDLDKFEN